MLAAGFLSWVSLGAEEAAKTTEETAPTAPESEDYVLQPSDGIKVIVFQEPDLEREVRLTREGTVTLPLIQTIDLKGKTLRQAAELIRQLYDKDFLVNPQITITVGEYAKRTVNVVGAVNKPGAIILTPEKKMRLQDAISEAGGPNRLANLEKVKLTRTLPDGAKQTITVNVDNLFKGVSSEEWLLQNGDDVYVPERIL